MLYVLVFVLCDGCIVFECVGYVYGNGCGVCDVDFVVECGGIMFVVGEIGVGKLIVFKLVLKLIELIDGCILVDGVDFVMIDCVDWYGVVVVVL